MLLLMCVDQYSIRKQNAFALRCHIKCIYISIFYLLKHFITISFMPFFWHSSDKMLYICICCLFYSQLCYSVYRWTVLCTISGCRQICSVQDAERRVYKQSSIPGRFSLSLYYLKQHDLSLKWK